MVIFLLIVLFIYAFIAIINFHLTKNKKAVRKYFANLGIFSGLFPIQRMPTLENPDIRLVLMILMFFLLTFLSHDYIKFLASDRDIESYKNVYKSAIFTVVVSLILVLLLAVLLIYA